MIQYSYILPFVNYPVWGPPKPRGYAACAGVIDSLGRSVSNPNRTIEGWPLDRFAVYCGDASLSTPRTCLGVSHLPSRFVPGCMWPVSVCCGIVSYLSSLFLYLCKLLGVKTPCDMIASVNPEICGKRSQPLVSTKLLTFCSIFRDRTRVRPSRPGPARPPGASPTVQPIGRVRGSGTAD